MTIRSLQDELDQARGDVKLLRDPAHRAETAPTACGVIASAFRSGLPWKYVDFPLITYSTWQYDELLAGDRTVGVSTMAGYTYNERELLSSGVGKDDIDIGTELTLVWGEQDVGSAKPQVDRHVQTDIRATVSRVPYSDVCDK